MAKKQEHGSESRELKQETVFNISVTVGLEAGSGLGCWCPGSENTKAGKELCLKAFVV